MDHPVTRTACYSLTLSVNSVRPSRRAGKLSNGADNLRGLVGLGDKTGVCGKIPGLYFELSGSRDDPDRRPPVSDRRRQFQTIHRTRHIDVGK